jgi:hypothetical protein
MEPRTHISTILRLLKIEQRISDSKVFFSNARTETARTLMKHLGDICGAVIRYTTADIKSPPQSARMAPAAIALLARLIIEQYETLYYLCFEKVSDSEREFRIELFGLHAQREAVKVKLSPAEVFFRLGRVNLVDGFAVIRDDAAKESVLHKLARTYSIPLARGSHTFL